MSVLIVILLISVIVLWSDVASLKRRMRDLEGVRREASVPQRSAEPPPLAVTDLSLLRPSSQVVPEAAPNDIQETPNVIAESLKYELSSAQAAKVGQARAAHDIAQADPAEPTPSTYFSDKCSTEARIEAGTELPLVSSASDGFSFIALVKNNLFAAAGIGLLLLGFAFLFHSISWGQVLPPAARIALVWACAGGLGYAGVRLSAKNRLWGQMAQGGAAAVAYLATYVASASYNLLAPSVALLVFAGISGALVARAFREDSKVLAGVGFLGAYAAPVLALHAHGSLGFYLAYGLVVTASALWASQRRRWLELAVHAHVCVAGMAVLTYTGHSVPLGNLAQQAFLHTYVLQFILWCVLWMRKTPSKAVEAPILATCLAMAGGVYLGMQDWLLEPTGFAASALAASLVFAVLAFRAFGPGVVRETSLVLAVGGVAAAISGAGLSHMLTGMGLFAEGVLLSLTTDKTAQIRRWLARALVAAGAFSIFSSGASACIALLVASYFLSLRFSKSRRDVDGWLYSAIAVVSAVLAVGATSAGFHDYWQPAVNLPVLLFVALAMTSASVLRKPTSLFPAPAVYAGFAALTWLCLVITPATGNILLHMGVLVLGLAVALVALRLRENRQEVSPSVIQAGPVLALAVLLMPALWAVKAHTSIALSCSLMLVGLVSFTLVERKQVLHKLCRVETAIPFTLNAGVAAEVAAVLSVMCLLPWSRQVLPSVPTVWLSGFAFLASWLSWSVFGARVAPPVRQVIASSVSLVGGYVWLCQVLEGLAPKDAWNVVAHSALLPLLLTAVGVTYVFHSSKRGHREAWQAAAVVCALAMLKLLFSLGAARMSPLGIAGSLLGMGALFLLAGYVAPLPPESPRTKPR